MISELHAMDVEPEIFGRIESAALCASLMVKFVFCMYGGTCECLANSRVVGALVVANAFEYFVLLC
jgi:hypothetical protein